MDLETSDLTFLVGPPFPEFKAHFSATACWHFSRDLTWHLLIGRYGQRMYLLRMAEITYLWEQF